MSLHLHVPLVAGVMFLSAACASMPPPSPLPPPEPVVVYRDRDVPVPQKCVPATVDRTVPTYPDTKAAVDMASDVRERAKLIAQANVQLHKRNDVLEQVLKGCG